MLIAGAAVGGLLLGRSRRAHHQGLKEASGVLQGVLLGLMGLVLAFALSLGLWSRSARPWTSHPRPDPADQ
jgi:hypothetical protein